MRMSDWSSDVCSSDLSLLCELLHVRLQHCGRRAGVGNWSLRSFFLAMFVAHRAIDKCPNGDLKFQTEAETISALQVGAIRPEMLNGWMGCCKGLGGGGWRDSFHLTEDESGKLVVGVFRGGGVSGAKGRDRRGKRLTSSTN